MTITKHSSDTEIQQAVTAWLEANWDQAERVPRQADKYIEREWLTQVVEAGWSVPSWSSEYYGLGLNGRQSRIIESAFKEYRAPGAARDRYHLGAITVYKVGSDTLKRAVLKELLTGPICCLLYSEPNAGSDLAGVRTRAVQDGNDYIINGQKVWTSNAMEAEYGMLLARTDWDAPKHQGITFFLFPMRQPGVEVRPINQITGESEFNEVFITDARVSAANIIGEVNQGWKAFQTAIAYERLIMGQGVTARRQKGNPTSHPLIRLADRAGKLADSHVRQKIAQAIAYRELNKLNNDRAKAEMAAGTGFSLMSLSKLAMSRIQHGEAALATELLGVEALLDGEQYPDARNAHFDSAKAYMNSIGGGTDQIQRNIIAEKVLGLPKEPEHDKGVPFREVHIRAIDE